MKKFLTIFIMCAFIAPLHATTKCVALNENSSCTSGFPGNGVGMWGSTCTTNGVSTYIRGHSICAAKSGVIGDTSNLWGTYVINTDSSQNIHCWCSAISPIGTNWVYAMKHSDYVDCIKLCAAKCSEKIHESSAFRKALFENII